jgi:membrane protease subunit HflK
VLRYFVSADMNEIMSSGRMEASTTLLDDIQKAADAYNLGARILSVDLEDLHPPVKVATDYEKVVGATQAKLAKILAARAFYIQTNALSGAQAVAVLNQASVYATQRRTGALARAGLFTNQIPAYEAAPSVYAERQYLQTFTRAVGATRKYVLLTTNTHDVLIFDLQDKLPYDIQNVTVPAPKTK